MSENILIVNYKVESEAYQALSELKRETSNSNYTISQAVIVKRESGKLEIQDGFNADASMGDDTWTGSLRTVRRTSGRQCWHDDRRCRGCE